MHELSLCRSIAQVVERTITDRDVAVVHLQVGKLRQVIPDTLRYCWGLVTDDTPLAGSTLEIESIPVVGRCSDCDAETTIEHSLILVCGACQSARLTIIRGEEFLITTVDLRSPVVNSTTEQTPAAL